MARVSITDLRGEVYDRLGDKKDNIVDSGIIDVQVNEALAMLVVEAEQLGFPIITSTATIEVDADTETIDLDAHLQDSDGDPNYRANLFITRTDTTYPVPVYWPGGGDHRVRELYRNVLTGNFNFPLTDGAGTIIPNDAPGTLVGPFMYKLDDRTIGYIKPPGSAQTLTAYYTPVVPILSTEPVRDTLDKINLTFFNAWKNLIVLSAAMYIASDSGVGAYATIERLQARELTRFLRTVGNDRRMVTPVLHSRWD